MECYFACRICGTELFLPSDLGDHEMAQHGFSKHKVFKVRPLRARPAGLCMHFLTVRLGAAGAGGGSLLGPRASAEVHVLLPRLRLPVDERRPGPGQDYVPQVQQTHRLLQLVGRPVLLYPDSSRARRHPRARPHSAPRAGIPSLPRPPAPLIEHVERGSHPPSRWSRARSTPSSGRAHEGRRGHRCGAAPAPGERGPPTCPSQRRTRRPGRPHPAPPSTAAPPPPRRPAAPPTRRPRGAGPGTCAACTGGPPARWRSTPSPSATRPRSGRTQRCAGQACEPRRAAETHTRARARTHAPSEGFEELGEDQKVLGPKRRVLWGKGGAEQREDRVTAAAPHPPPLTLPHAPPVSL